MRLSSLRFLRFCLFLLGFGFSATFARATTVTTSPPTGFGPGSVTLNATTALSGGAACFGFFEYGLTTNYSNETSQQFLGAAAGNVNFNQPLTGLGSNQVYHFRADVIVLNNGTVLGKDLTFFMPGPPPATTAAATSIHPGAATLNASINPNNTNNAPTSWWFQHGKTTNYGSVTIPGTIPSGTSLVAVSNLVTGLPRGVTYHFRVVASNLFGESFGSDLSLSVPQGPTTASTSTGSGQAFDIRQPCLELNFIIATNGVYPEEDGNIAVPQLAQVSLFAGNFAPAGWLLCQGQLMSVSSNTALFSLLGTQFGGDGLTNFNLPDLRGQKPVGAGDGAGLRPWLSGERFGETQHTLLLAELPAHTHSLPLPDSVTGTTGGGAPRNNIQPSLALDYLIAPFGVFPTTGGATITEPFLGEVVMYAGGFDAPGAFANGQPVSINQNTAMFNLLGTTYGGDGVSTFKLPDLRGRVPLGVGQGQVSLWTQGESTGAENVTITEAQMPAHQHTMSALGTVTGFDGGNQAQSLIQPSLVIQYLICTNGGIPSPTALAQYPLLGEITMYAGTNLPGGWSACDGRLMPVAGFPSLFGVISNWYGGNGTTTFALPDLRGRAPVGTANGQPGAAYGNEQTVLTVANLPPHTHTGPAPDYDRWVTSFGLSNAVAAFSADADADNAGNGYEWATGSTPTNAQSRAPLTINSSSGKANIHFPRNTNATDVIFTVQRSTNLTRGVWTGIATNQSGVWTSSATVTETGATNPLNVTVSTPLSNAPAANYRLQITWP